MSATRAIKTLISKTSYLSYLTCLPPSICSVSPVMKSFSINEITADDTSLRVPIRPAGLALDTCSPVALLLSAGGRIAPRANSFTWTFGAIAAASDLFRPERAPLLAP